MSEALFIKSAWPVGDCRAKASWSEGESSKRACSYIPRTFFMETLRVCIQKHSQIKAANPRPMSRCTFTTYCQS